MSDEDVYEGSAPIDWDVAIPILRHQIREWHDLPDNEIKELFKEKCEREGGIEIKMGAILKSAWEKFHGKEYK